MPPAWLIIFTFTPLHFGEMPSAVNNMLSDSLFDGHLTAS